MSMGCACNEHGMCVLGLRCSPPLSCWCLVLSSTLALLTFVTHPIHEEDEEVVEEKVEGPKEKDTSYTQQYL